MGGEYRRIVLIEFQQRLVVGFPANVDYQQPQQRRGGSVEIFPRDGAHGMRSELAAQTELRISTPLADAVTVEPHQSFKVAVHSHRFRTHR